MMHPPDYLEEALSIQWITAHVTVVDPRWVEVPAALAGQRAWINRHERLSVIASAAPQDDGRRWLHFSCAGRDQVPTWEQLVRVKEAFLGRESKAIQVLAPPIAVGEHPPPLPAPVGLSRRGPPAGLHPRHRQPLVEPLGRRSP